MIVLTVVLTAALSATTAGFVVHVNQRRHDRHMRQSGEYWRGVVLRLCAGEPDRERRPSS